MPLYTLHLYVLLSSTPVLTYYDIFVRNAFGNYRDMLREIAYSPLMGENLSFLQSKSAAYMWENQQVISFADENFVSWVSYLPVP
jgi:cullin-associated NEDD8-dissociated protein 1